jgi:hypothetical protein
MSRLRTSALVGPPGQASTGGELHLIGTAGLLLTLPQVPTNRERFYCLLQSRALLTHADAIEALWGEGANGGPLYAKNILAIYVSRLRRTGHSIDNYPGVGYRLRKGAFEISSDLQSLSVLRGSRKTWGGGGRASGPLAPQEPYCTKRHITTSARQKARTSEISVERAERGSPRSKAAMIA